MTFEVIGICQCSFCMLQSTNVKFPHRSHNLQPLPPLLHLLLPQPLRHNRNLQLPLTPFGAAPPLPLVCVPVLFAPFLSARLLPPCVGAHPPVGASLRAGVPAVALLQVGALPHIVATPLDVSPPLACARPQVGAPLLQQRPCHVVLSAALRQLALLLPLLHATQCPLLGTRACSLHDLTKWRLWVQTHY